MGFSQEDPPQQMRPSPLEGQSTLLVPMSLFRNESPYPRIITLGVSLHLSKIALWSLGSHDAFVLRENEMLMKAEYTKEVELVHFSQAVKKVL